MGQNRRFFVRLALALPAAGLLATRGEAATSGAQISRDASSALQRLYATEPRAKELAKRSLAVLVFPKITKAGLIVGGQYGEGALFEKGQTVGYYSIAAGSFGLQIGGQTFSYALFFLNQSALDYLKKSEGWAIGSGPSVVVADKGAAASATSTTISQDVVAFPFGQKGLMAGLGLEGSKITRINR
jgi:lipid-binding SYLF domain-containing protein